MEHISPNFSVNTFGRSCMFVYHSHWQSTNAAQLLPCSWDEAHGLQMAKTPLRQLSTCCHNSSCLSNHSNFALHSASTDLQKSKKAEASSLTSRTLASVLSAASSALSASQQIPLSWLMPCLLSRMIQVSDTAAVEGLSSDVTLFNQLVNSLAEKFGLLTGALP